MITILHMFEQYTMIYDLCISSNELVCLSSAP
uniref:Uncharacterized protein n=1 Tax=Arundo donax TaxID=35708 RepID=A0A0A9BM11_ARUDO